MLRIIIYGACAVALVVSITLKDCVTNKDDRVISVSDIKVTPEELSFPGDFNVSINLTFNRDVVHPTVDFELTRYLFGFPLKLPCRDDTVIGTCNHIDICWLLNRSIHDPDHQDSYGHKLNNLMNKTTGHFWQCPIKKVDVVVKDEPFSLTNLSSIVNLLVNGDYTIKVIARENKTIIGCVEVNATITGQPGSIFG